MRALAILGVLLYHGDLAWFPGGFLGVDLFFVLSGFLVTALLLEEAGELGGINIPAFYARRLRRLFPALAALLLVLLAVVPFIAPDAHRRTDQDALPALLYAANWWFIFNEGSYFDFIGRPPLLQHLWSLAIEEQFYLLWPCALMLILQVGNRRTVGLVALATALLSTGWMWQLAMLADLPEQGDPSRLYFGTDTHCMGLFVGAALAAFTRPFGNAHRPLPGGLVLARDFLGFAGLAVLVLAFLLIGEQQPALYRGGFLVVACAAAAVLFAVLSPGSLLAWILERPALQWLGQRSYGLYLWHWPVFMLTRPDLDTPLNGVANLVFRLLLVGLIAELSYRLVENPIRNGSFLRLFGAGLGMAAHVRRRLVFGVLIVGAPGVAALVLQNASEHPSPQGLRGHGIPSDIAEAMGIAKGGPLQVTVTPARLNSETINTEGAPTRFNAPAPQPAVLGWPDPVAPPAGAEAVVSERPEPPAEIPKPLHPSTAELAVSLNETLTAVGDSVLLGARQQLEQTLPKAQTDAEIGRQAAALLVRLRALKESNLLAGTVMLHLGTNGYVTEKQLREALETLGDRERIILVNARAPRRWVEENNSLMARVVAEYPNAVLADWAGLANDHPEYFVSDGIHLSQAGKRAFVEQILAAAGLSRKATDNAAAAGSVEKEVDARLLTNVGVGQLPEDRQVAECSTGIFWATPEDLVARDALRLPEPSGLTGLPLFGRRVQVAALNLDLALPMQADALPIAELPASWHCLGGEAGLGP
jgi:peptidoglycan/LPS O-acetylase OafA/YrhL